MRRFAMRKLASVQYVHDVWPIADADRIECVGVLGWRCVARKGEFKVGDLFNEGLTKQDITGIEYVSRLTKTEYTFQYEINYTFPTRIWNNQTYKVEGTINNDRISTYINLCHFWILLR